MFEHFRVFFFGLVYSTIGGYNFITNLIEYSLMRLFYMEVVCAFASIPFDGGSSILSVEERMFSSKKSIEFSYDFVMIIFEI